MVYKSQHNRTVRGGAVHDTLKIRKEKQKETKQQDLLYEELQPEAREKVEAKYLIPTIKNFVETESVKNYENRVNLWLKSGYPVHIIGPTGCGKTTLAMAIAKERGRPVVWINGDESVTTTDLIGGYSQVEQKTLSDRFIHNVFKSKNIMKADWVDNPLTLACKYGYTLVYNEFSRTKPEANNVLLSVLEEKILELPTKYGEERYVNVHPDFRLVLTSNNIEYAGVHKAQDALLDRLIGIHMDYYDFDTEVKIVKAQTKVSIDDARKIVTTVRGLREQLNGAEKPGTRAGIMIGHGLKHANGSGENYFKQICIDSIASKFSGYEDLNKKMGMLKNLIAK